MKKVIIVSAFLLSSLGYVSAETAAVKAAAPAKPIQSWTCQDFLGLDEAYQPTAIGVAQVINEKKNTDKVYLDVAGIETVTPEILAVCKENPNTKFTKAVVQAKKVTKAKKAAK